MSNPLSPCAVKVWVTASSFVTLTFSSGATELGVMNAKPLMVMTGRWAWRFRSDRDGPVEPGDPEAVGSVASPDSDPPYASVATSAAATSECLLTARIVTLAPLEASARDHENYMHSLVAS